MRELSGLLALTDVLATAMLFARASWRSRQYAANEGTDPTKGPDALDDPVALLAYVGAVMGRSLPPPLEAVLVAKARRSGTFCAVLALEPTAAPAGVVLRSRPALRSGVLSVAFPRSRAAAVPKSRRSSVTAQHDKGAEERRRSSAPVPKTGVYVRPSSVNTAQATYVA